MFAFRDVHAPEDPRRLDARGRRRRPVLSALVQYWAREAWDYRIGFELLIYNAVFTMAGMLLLAKKNEN